MTVVSQISNFVSASYIAISIDGVEKLLNNINIHSAGGPDRIPYIIIKTCSKSIYSALANIFLAMS